MSHEPESDELAGRPGRRNAERERDGQQQRNQRDEHECYGPGFAQQRGEQQKRADQEGQRGKRRRQSHQWQLGEAHDIPSERQGVRDDRGGNQEHTAARHTGTSAGQRAGDQRTCAQIGKQAEPVEQRDCIHGHQRYGRLAAPVEYRARASVPTDARYGILATSRTGNPSLRTGFCR